MPTAVSCQLQAKEAGAELKPGSQVIHNEERAKGIASLRIETPAETTSQADEAERAGAAEHA